MVGQLMLFFVKDTHKNAINSIKTTRVETALGGNTGNKGAVCIRFNYNDSSFLLFNCHLTSGQEHNMQRLDDFTQIYQKAFDSSKGYQEYTTD